MGDFVMPSLGADMERGILNEWLVKPGDAVAKGDIIAVVETDKGAIEVEVWSAGVIEELCVDEGTDTPVGTVLARIRETENPASEPSAAATATPSPPPEPVATTPAPPAPAPSAPAEARGRVMASPWARHLAAERGVALTGVTGSGPLGAVLGRDVPAAAAKTAHPKPDKVDQLAAMRRAVAKAMARSKREIPHYYLGTDVDVTGALAWLARRNASVPPPERLLPAVIWLKAVAAAIRKVPQVNGFWQDDALRLSEPIHLGFAVSLRGGGLVAPALHDVDQRTPVELMRAMTDLVTRARRGRLRGAEMTDATLTVTSMGERGVERVDGVIYPPQVAIVGLGKVVERPWVVDGEVAVRKVMHVSLAGDHRAHDGHTGGLFLNALADALSAPEAL
ncbi:MAG: 2-oxo acid dehydrogenase subunit E2 [Deltaproteobacteria bacterium]|nr:MAG: 2-oxo acid dehydrogenase subunit E2 [Deltaproteobacteria bacterium]